MLAALHFLEQSFLWLFLYSVLGWIYETTLCSIRQKRFVNRGFLNGPYCPIYGWGAVLDIWALGWVENPVLLFFLGALLTCTLEYLTSFLMEKLFHARWWDYSNRKFQIHGRVCLAGAVVFGSLSVLLLKVVHPLTISLLAMVPTTTLTIITVLLFLLFLADNIVTFAGFSGFDAKLKTLSTVLGEKKDAVQKTIQSAKTGAINKRNTVIENNVLLKKLTYQQRRMIRAFPKLKSLQHNTVLTELRTALREKKKQ